MKNSTTQTQEDLTYKRYLRIIKRMPEFFGKSRKEKEEASRREIASALRKEGVATSIIIAATGLTAEEIEACTTAATDSSK